MILRYSIVQAPENEIVVFVAIPECLLFLLLLSIQMELNDDLRISIVIVCVRKINNNKK